MESRKHLMPKEPAKLKLTVTENFLNVLETVVMFGSTVFGDKVSERFYKGIMSRIESIQSFPNANPKSRFIPSSERKIYRNVIYGNYYIIYSVTKTTIRIISLIHQATCPKTIGKIK